MIPSNFLDFAAHGVLCELQQHPPRLSLEAQYRGVTLVWPSRPGWEGHALR